MSLTHVSLKVANPGNLRRFARVRCLVDSGAFYSLVPGSTLRRIGIVPHSTRMLALADGSVINRQIGDAVFVLDGHRGASPVIFGEPGDSILLGVLSLEALGLVLDPKRGELQPLDRIPL
ncbi:MAG TPA: aspartyl protease [bacterium]|nr:aspartyl protease [bacterium]